MKQACSSSARANGALKVSLALVFALILSLCITALSAAQGVRLGPSASAPGQITAETAVSDARHFLSLCELPAPDARIRSRLDHNINGVIWDVSFGGDYEVDVDAGNGQPVFFDNNRRTWQRIHSRQKVSSPLPTDRKGASDRLWHLARAIGLPPQATLARLEINARGAGATFSVRPHGYPFLERSNGMALVLDPQDSQPVYFSQHWNLVPVSWTRRLTRNQATARGRSAYRNWYAQHNAMPYNGLHGGKQPTPPPPVLGYVVPNGAFGGRASKQTTSPEVRLAWAVPIGDVAVYVDAGDGTILGGGQPK